jgi:hypothetical protein
MRDQSITASLRRSPVVAIGQKNVPERRRHRYAGRGQLIVLSAVLVFWPYGVPMMPIDFPIAVNAPEHFTDVGHEVVVGFLLRSLDPMPST